MPSGRLIREMAQQTPTVPATLSVLDTGVPEQTVDLARRIESVGYDRIWVTEHHTETQSACPAVMAAAVLASTTSLSVTVGGVLARIHSPYFIAQQLKLLAKLYGDRIQFGVAGGTVGADYQNDRTRLSGRISVEERDFDDGRDATGAEFDQDFRDRTTTTSTIYASYALTPNIPEKMGYCCASVS